MAGSRIIFIAVLLLCGHYAHATTLAAPNATASLPEPQTQTETTTEIATPAQSPTPDPTEDALLDRQRLHENRPLATPATSTDSAGWWRTIGALALVLALILAMRWFLKRGRTRAASTRTPQIVELVSRTAVSPRHNVMLIRVGQRLLVVGAGADTMTTLAEITDAEQVAQLLGQLEQSRPTSLSGTFAETMGAWTGQIDGAEALWNDTADAPATPARRAADRLRQMLQRAKGMGKASGRWG